MRWSSLTFGMMSVGALLCATGQPAMAEDFPLPQQKIGEQASDLSLLFEEDELFISATQSARTLGKAPAIATVITDKQLKNMGARNLLDALATVPGFGVSYASEFAIENTIEVRGIKTAESEKVLLMIDGHRLNMPYGGAWTMQYDDFPIDQVQRIEVIRGPGSALYGANAFVAAINVIMKKPDSENRLTVIGGGGNHKQARTQAGYNGEVGPLRIAGYYNWQSSGGTRQFVASDAAAQSGYTNYWKRNQSAHVIAEVGKFSFTGDYMLKRRGSPMSIINTIDYATELRNRHLYGEAAYRDTIDGFNVEAKLGVEHFKWDVDWQLNIPLFANIGNPRATNRTYSGSLKVQKALFDKHYLTFGLERDFIRQYDVQHILDGVDVSATFNHNQDAKRNIVAAYLQDEWEVMDNLLLTAGVRFDQYSDFGKTTNPRAALVWSVTDHLDLKLLYGRAFRAPTFLEMYEQNNAVAVGNPNLKPEKMSTIEAGAIWKLSHNYQLTANVFQNRFTDKITRQFPQSVNSGGATIRGFEAELKADWQEHLYGYINYSYQRSRDSQTLAALPDVPMHRFRIGANAGLFDDYLNVNGTLRWDGKRKRAVGDTRAATPSNTVIDLALSSDKLMKGLRLSFKAHNLLDSKIYDPSPATVTPGYPRPGREMMGEAEYGF